MTFRLRDIFDGDADSLLWQDIGHDIGPFHDDDGLGIGQPFLKLVLHNAGFAQAIKIIMIEGELASLILLTDHKGGAGHGVCTPHASGKAPDKGSFTATEVAHKFNYFSAPKEFTDFFAECFGILGVFG